jgi:hypothetical protein
MSTSTKIEKEERKLKNKLARVVSKAGLSWVRYSSILEMADEVDGYPINTAAWYYNEKTKQEKVCISTRLLKELPVPLLVLVLRHEFLHKAMYRNIKGASNKTLINYCLDAAINKILFMSAPKRMIQLCNYLFPADKESRFGVMCIMNCSMQTFERQKLPNNLREVFDEIYTVKTRSQVYDSQTGHYISNNEVKTCADCYKGKRVFNKHIPDPLTLYNTLSAILTPEQKKEIEEEYEYIFERDGEKEEEKEEGEGKGNGSAEESQEEEDGDEAREEEKKKIRIRGGTENKRNSSKQNVEMEKDSTKIICAESYSTYSDMRAYFQKYVYAQKETETDGLEEFVKRWQTDKLVEGVAHSIYQQIVNRPTINPYPFNLSRLGQELVTIGFSGYDIGQVPLFWNEDPESLGKKKICCYFDTSPSMNSYIPYMVYIADFFDSRDDCELAGGEFEGKYCFSEAVRGIKDWEAFTKGKVRGGYGTSFEDVVKHALSKINENEVDVVVIFTDGYSGVRQETIDRFNQTGKKCYNIYFTHANKSYGWYHERRKVGNTQQQEMTSDLDNLEGESYTIFCQEEK